MGTRQLFNTDLRGMKNPEIIIMINTLLVSLMGVSMSVLSFFLKDVYRDYKKLSEQVNHLHREVNTHMRLSQEQMQLAQKLTERHRQQIEQLQRQCAKVLANITSE